MLLRKELSFLWWLHKNCKSFSKNKGQSKHHEETKVSKSRRFDLFISILITSHFFGFPEVFEVLIIDVDRCTYGSSFYNLNHDY